jgi:hypothetical protein
MVPLESSLPSVSRHNERFSVAADRLSAAVPGMTDIRMLG